MNHFSHTQHTAFIADQENGTYQATRELKPEDILNLAEHILWQQIKHREVFTSSEKVKRYLTSKLSLQDIELFVVLFLDNKHRLIHSETLFNGTYNQCAVYPREVIKRALSLNAGALILAHNHPSTDVQPSVKDKEITEQIKMTAQLFDIRVLDHIIVGGAEAFSFAEKGLI